MREGGWDRGLPHPCGLGEPLARVEGAQDQVQPAHDSRHRPEVVQGVQDRGGPCGKQHADHAEAGRISSFSGGPSVGGPSVSAVRCLASRSSAWSVVRRGGLVAPSPSPAQRTQKRGAGTDQKAEVVPVSTSRLAVEGELLPAAEDVDDKDDPGRKPVPEPPQ